MENFAQENNAALDLISERGFPELWGSESVSVFIEKHVERVRVNDERPWIIDETGTKTITALNWSNTYDFEEQAFGTRGMTKRIYSMLYRYRTIDQYCYFANGAQELYGRHPAGYNLDAMPELAEKLEKELSWTLGAGERTLAFIKPLATLGIEATSNHH